ncbi:MAG: glycoside hydrolase family 43 protein [Bacteroidales bacterium]|nr:glycoside hydrolase family 43 protein [Bacteroidales bacterium]
MSAVLAGCSTNGGENDGDGFSTTIDSTFVNPVWDGADPWMVKKDSFYYYCFTENNAIKVSKSRIMTERNNIKTVWEAPETGWNKNHIWAPELHYVDGRWYIYYAAGREGPPFIHQRSGVLKSAGEDALGEYEETGMLYTSDHPENKTSIWAIDVTVLQHHGELYAIWSGWKDNAETDQTPQHLYIAPMKDPHTLAGPRVKISSPEKDWETGGPLDLNEGPQVLKTDTGVFIIYSCRESWLKEYRLGQLRLKSYDADPLKPENWIKSGPVFQGTEKVYGTGHASFVKSPDGTEDWIIYHSKKSTEPGWNRDIRMQQFHWNNDGSPDFGEPIPVGVPLKRPSGEVDIEKKLLQ